MWMKCLLSHRAAAGARLRAVKRSAGRAHGAAFHPLPDISVGAFFFFFADCIRSPKCLCRIIAFLFTLRCIITIPGLESRLQQHFGSVARYDDYINSDIGSLCFEAILSISTLESLSKDVQL